MMLVRPLLLAALIAAIPAPALAGSDDLPDWKSDAAGISLPVKRSRVGAALTSLPISKVTSKRVVRES